jgi:predicted outer membrane protein
MVRSTRGAFILVLALAAMGCRKEGEQAPPATQTSATYGPAPVAAEVPVSAGGATSAPLPPAPTAAPSSAAQPPPDDTLRDRAPLTDEQIAAVTATASGALLDQAKLARQKAKDAGTRKLADQLIGEQATLEKTRTQTFEKLGLKPAPSALSDELGSEASSTLATLKKARAPDFDSVYLEAQLRNHQKLLELFDAQLIPNAKRVDLRSHLQTARAHLQSRLENINQLQAARAPKAPAPGAAAPPAPPTPAALAPAPVPGPTATPGAAKTVK